MLKFYFPTDLFSSISFADAKNKVFNFLAELKTYLPWSCNDSVKALIQTDTAQDADNDNHDVTALGTTN